MLLLLGSACHPCSHTEVVTRLPEHVFLSTQLHVDESLNAHDPEDGAVYFLFEPQADRVRAWKVSSPIHDGWLPEPDFYSPERHALQFLIGWDAWSLDRDGRWTRDLHVDDPDGQFGGGSGGWCHFVGGGHRIACLQSRHERHELTLRSLDGSAPQTLAIIDDRMIHFFFSASPDGGHFLYRSDCGSYDCLFRVDRHGANKLAVWREKGDSVDSVAWSPGGAQLAVIRVTDNPNGPREKELWVMRNDGGEPHKVPLPSPVPGEHWGVQAAGWTSDGSRLVFLSDLDHPCGRTVGEDLVCSCSVYVVAPDGSGFKRISERTGRDGRLLVID